MITKKTLNKTALEIKKTFLRMDWIKYFERNLISKTNYKQIEFTYAPNSKVIFPLTEMEYLYWRAIKPKLREQKIGEKLK